MPINTLNSSLHNLRNRHFFYIDILLVLISPFLALFVRYDGLILFMGHFDGVLIYVFIFSILKLSIFGILGLYRRFWAHASVDDLGQLLLTSIITLLIQVFLFNLIRIFSPDLRAMPSSLPYLDAAIAMILVSTLRFSVRLFERASHRLNKHPNKENILVIGAGDAGTMVVQETQKYSKIGMNCIGFIDDDPIKQKMRVRGIPVLGTRSEIGNIAKAHNIKKVVIAMPTAQGIEIRKILEICKEAELEVLTVPSMSDIISGRIRVDKFRKIDIEDLLRRDPITTDLQEIAGKIQNKVIMITGAGGSIGSEICRQICEGYPKKIILLGHGENSIFEIEQELRSKLYNKPIIIEPIIADIRFNERLDWVFRTYEPEIIFHAAAHKHVPLMENNPSEAISNNIIGTRNLISLAIKYNVEAFTMISTDKAVNPTNIMGMSKRIAEIIVLSAANYSNKKFSVVRFGNVLGSRGSVVNIFRKQIVAGGPVTVTDPRMIRYFMTIPEAVQLVLQSFVLGKGGEIFVLDMGEPHKIVDLASDMITLSGFEVGRDIEIKFVGVRPGEKLYEELFYSDEDHAITAHNKVFRSSDIAPLRFDSLTKRIDDFVDENRINNYDNVINELKSLMIELNHKEENVA
ncbi:MAG: nucleoside-diphosphate sugar epimerase/dehydratase [Melioribacteraceae bacterium]